MRPAIVGLGAIGAVGVGVEALGRALLDGRSAISAQPWGDDGPAYGAALPELALGEALAACAGAPTDLRQHTERTLRRAPRQVQAAAAAALEAWLDARLHEAPVPPDRVALVIAGNNLTGAYVEAARAAHVRSPQHVSPRFALCSLDTDHVGTVSEVLGVRGEGFTVGAASASGNLALIQACRLLAAGEADVCVVVGALAEPSSLELAGLAATGAMAARRAGEPERLPPAPFDRDRRGFVLGQASACVILESPTSAHRRRVAARAYLTGHAAGLDATRLPSPSVEGERLAMARALARAELSPDQLSYVNAHGTGSELGDATELDALAAVLGDAGPAVWINSTKAITGHCMAAAGVLEAVATTVQLQRDFVHGMPGLVEPLRPKVRLPRHAQREVRLERALSNSFGFAGISSSLVLAHPRAVGAAALRSVAP